jgi:hypothetical protein
LPYPRKGPGNPECGTTPQARPPSPTTSAGAGDENLKSLVKVARILDCFSTVTHTLSLGEISGGGARNAAMGFAQARSTHPTALLAQAAAARLRGGNPACSSSPTSQALICSARYFE